MKTRALMLCCTVLILLMSAAAFADEKAEADFAAMMERYMQAATPGDQHRLLEKLAGRFDVRGQMWTTPGQEPVESSGVAEARMILGGRYLEQKFRGDFMGMPFEGIALTGYDNVSKEFVGTWIDSMGTGFMTSTGSADDSGSVLSFTARWNDPILGPTDYDEKVTIVDDDHHIMEMWGPAPDGTRYKMMELHYTRAE
jgi:hypothetical protein